MPEDSFYWKTLLRKSNIIAAPVSCFKHLVLSRTWENIITTGVLVEVKSPDCTTCCVSTPCCFWIAAITKVSGYMGLLRYEGFDHDDSMDMWVNLCSDPNVHPIGWCAETGMPLVPPKCIEDKHSDWKEYLMRRISKVRTIPSDFAFKVDEQNRSVIKKGMKLETIDKNLISAMRVVVVTNVVGGRLCLQYEDNETGDEDLWCHERSPMVHPIGWSQLIGHSLKANPEYALTSLSKTLCRTFEPNEATWEMFTPVPNYIKTMKFKEGIKLEAIDPLNLSTVCVATVTKVLRNNYLMIGIDGVTNGSDSFCYHSSSPYIFPVGFCESNGIDLTPPKGHKGDFKWQEYLKKTKSKAATPGLFYRDIPNHGFHEGMYLEAVDLMDPKLICVASISRVVGRLLHIHFDGWEDIYDQWCDCESPDLFPMGWCEAVGYHLEPPRSESDSESKDVKKNPKNIPKTRRRKKQVSVPRKRNQGGYGGADLKIELGDSDYNMGNDSNSS